MMLMERANGRTRLQCARCGAHALLRPADYRELVTHTGGLMRCEVCGSRGRFVPTTPSERAVPARA
jgi:hypothetical protein